MEILRNGKFTETIQSKTLARGLRNNKNNPRDKFAFTKLNSMIGKDNVLQTLPEITKLITTEITDSFPYPQIFVFTNYIIICDSTKIYEYNGTLDLKYTASSAGETWKAIDFIEYLLLTNGDIFVYRDASSGNYLINSDIPKAKTLCNYNGQVFLGGLS